jgi:hypothetical protein
MTVKLTVTIDEGDKPALDTLCLSLGYSRGGRPNISELFRSIASGEVMLIRKKQVVEEEENGEF